MRTAAAQRQARGRGATRLVLRLWAGLLALLLCGSSLGEAAHLLLVQHTVCAEHGELIEHHDGDAAAEAAGRHEPSERGSAPVEEREGEHEHCQLLARTQQDLALPEIAAVTAIPQAAAISHATLNESTSALTTLSALSLAPKTSPPSPAAFG